MGRKRGNGEGSIYQRQDKRWCCSLTIGPGRRKTIYGKTRKEVAEKLQIALRLRAEGRYSGGARQTVAHYVTLWLAGLPGTVRPLTEMSYRTVIEVHILPALGATELTKLTPEHVSTLFQDLQARGLAPSTIGNVRTVLRIALNHALRHGMVLRNVASLVAPLRIPTTPTPVLTPEQARAFIAACEQHQDGALFILALTCGLRAGELRGLQWRDVDLDGATLTVARSLQRIGGQDVLVEVKTDRSHRTIALPAVTIAVLKAHRVAQLRERMVAGAAWQDLGLVFTGATGGPRPRTTIRRHLDMILVAAALPDLHLHSLRHCCASLLLAANVQPKYVQELLGHASITITLDRYSHCLPAARLEVAEHMERLVAVG